MFFIFLISITSLSLASSILRFSHAPAEVVAFWRLIIASFLIAGFAYYQNPKIPLQIIKKKLPWIILCAFLFFTHLWTYFFAAHNTSIANCMIIFSVNPLFTALGARIFFKEYFGKRLIAAYIIAFIGVFILVREGLSFEHQIRSGDWMALVTAALISGYLLVSRHIRQEISNTYFTSTLYFFTALFALATTVLTQQSVFNIDHQTQLTVVALAIIPTIMGHSFFTYLMGKMNINVLSFGKLLEPAIASSAALFLFHEPITSTKMLAFTFTSIALGVLFLPKKI